MSWFSRLTRRRQKEKEPEDWEQLEHTQQYTLKSRRDGAGSCPFPRAELVVRSGMGTGRKISLAQSVSTVGRRETNEVFLEDPNMSRVHARIEVTGNTFVLVDLGSTNGTYVNGRRIQQVTLKDGDLIRLGKTELSFSSQDFS